jgi:hypothetical protein
MDFAKTPTHVELGVNDVAFIIRGKTKLELLVPHADSKKKLSSDQVALVTFAISFYDERLRDLLGQIFEERRAAGEAEDKASGSARAGRVGKSRRKVVAGAKKPARLKKPPRRR